MIRLCLILIIICLSGCNEPKYTELVIKHNATLQKMEAITLPLNFTSEVIIWSFGTIYDKKNPFEKQAASLICFALPWKNKNRVLIECLDNENSIRTQVVVECVMNNSEENALYLFFGKVGVKFAHRNFYLYCQ